MYVFIFYVAFSPTRKLCILLQLADMLPLQNITKQLGADDALSYMKMNASLSKMKKAGVDDEQAIIPF